MVYLLRGIESLWTNFLIRFVNVKGVKYNTCNRVLYAIMDKSTTHKNVPLYSNLYLSFIQY